MKKIMNKANMAIIGMMVSMPAFAANDGLCKLIDNLRGVFETLRVLAFVGAAFVIADWAWTWIKSGDLKKDDVKDKGVAMITGFALLFAIGIFLTFFLDGKVVECAAELKKW